MPECHALKYVFQPSDNRRGTFYRSAEVASIIKKRRCLGSEFYFVAAIAHWLVLLFILCDSAWQPILNTIPCVNIINYRETPRLVLRIEFR